MSASAESKRIKLFREGLAKQIPRFPNNKESLRILKAKGLSDVLINYINWASRYVAARPRKVTIDPNATSDPRWNTLQQQISLFLEKVRRGDDLTPHLSLEAHTRGFTPAASGVGSKANRWADKDMLLNGMGYHHFHLGTTLEPAGHAARMNDLLFAQVTRTDFEVVGIFDHTVFDIQISPMEPMSAERERFWKIFDERLTRDTPVGSVIVATYIATSGHSTATVHKAIRYARIVRDMDPKLDDLTYVRSFYDGLAPKKPKLEWRMRHLDLCLICHAAECTFVLEKGPN